MQKTKKSIEYIFKRNEKNFALYVHLDQSTVISHSSRSTQKSLPLPSVAKYSRSPTLTKPEKISPQRSPLLLNYAQLHKSSSSPSPILRSRQARLSIYQIPNDKQHGMPNVNEKPLPTSKASAASTTTASSIPTKVFNGLPNNNLVRLNTPQLRRLNVSEQYMNEAKKLYFNADCKIFVPYTSTTAVF